LKFYQKLLKEYKNKYELEVHITNEIRKLRKKLVICLSNKLIKNICK